MHKSDDDGRLGEKLDKIIQLLEDLFILQASQANIGRDNIRAVLHVRNTRVARIRKGLKQARPDA